MVVGGRLCVTLPTCVVESSFFHTHQSLYQMKLLDMAGFTACFEYPMRRRNTSRLERSVAAGEKWERKDSGSRRNQHRHVKPAAAATQAIRRIGNADVVSVTDRSKEL